MFVGKSLVLNCVQVKAFLENKVIFCYNTRSKQGERAMACACGEKLKVISRAANLVVEEVDLDSGIEEIQALLLSWEERSSYMLSDCSGFLDAREIVRLESANNLCRAMSMSLDRRDCAFYGPGVERMFLCKDTAANKILSLVTLNQTSSSVCLKGEENMVVEIFELVTSPDNLPISINSERISGAGRVLVQRVMEVSKENPAIIGVSARSIDSAIGFYKRCGFERVHKGDLRPEDVVDKNLMVLPREDLDSLSKKTA
jgi:hypothetical protein